MLYACPYESTVALEPAPVEAIDSSLLGYWYGIVKDGSDFFGIEALDISRKTDSTYAIIRYGKAAKGDMIVPDTNYFTGYTSYIGQQRFMNIESSITTQVKGKGKKGMEAKTQKVFYLANFEVHADTLSMKTISEGFSPAHKNFRSHVELKNEIVAQTAQKKKIYDDLYSLSYRKIARPIPLNAF